MPRATCPHRQQWKEVVTSANGRYVYGWCPVCRGKQRADLGQDPDEARAGARDVIEALGPEARPRPRRKRF